MMLLPAASLGSYQLIIMCAKTPFQDALQSMPTLTVSLFHSACSHVDFSQGLSASQQYFPLTINQHQPSLSAQSEGRRRDVSGMDQWSKAKTIIVGMPLPCAIDCIYVCMGGTHIISVFSLFACWFQSIQTSQLIVFFSHNKPAPVSLNQLRNPSANMRVVVLALYWLLGLRCPPQRFPADNMEMGA